MDDSTRSSSGATRTKTSKESMTESMMESSAYQAPHHTTKAKAVSDKHVLSFIVCFNDNVKSALVIGPPAVYTIICDPSVQNQSHVTENINRVFHMCRKRRRLALIWCKKHLFVTIS